MSNKNMFVNEKTDYDLQVNLRYNILSKINVGTRRSITNFVQYLIKYKLMVYLETYVKLSNTPNRYIND